VKHAVCFWIQSSEQDLHTEDAHQDDSEEGDTQDCSEQPCSAGCPQDEKLRSNMQQATDNPLHWPNSLSDATSKRRHTMEELMRFMQRGDLPVADDGSIVIHKILRKRKIDGHEEFDYVDCHTGKVLQSVVATCTWMNHLLIQTVGRNVPTVCMSLVVATPVALVVMWLSLQGRPEDVVAVPQYDSNKMRVCGHILYGRELNDEDFQALRSNQPIKTSDGKRNWLTLLQANTLVRL
jgi:hypothetical protein